MKDFLSIEKFKEVKVFLVLEICMSLLIIMLISVNNYNIIYWNWKAFMLSFFIWILSSIIDTEKYWNLATLIGVGFFMYLMWWYIFNIVI